MSKKNENLQIIKEGKKTNTGGNKTYIHGDDEKSRAKMVREVKNCEELQKTHHVVHPKDGSDYVRSNPDASKRDNINKPTKNK